MEIVQRVGKNITGSERLQRSIGAGEEGVGKNMLVVWELGDPSVGKNDCRHSINASVHCGG